jgi:hypothetical protein
MVIGIKFRAVTKVVGRHGAHVGIGLSEARGSGIHNTLLLIVLVSTSDSMFWEDSWLGNVPHREQYPALYNNYLLQK